MANYSDIKYQAAGSATAIYSDMAALIAATGMSAGDQALVTALNKVFMYTGSAWYLVATMTNASPTAITGVSGSYDLAIDGTATTITAVSTDPEGFPLTWSYAVTTGSLGSTATVSQADNVFTITPSSTPAAAASFSITFSVTDGASGAVNAVSAFTLAFVVTDTRYTALSVKATATGSNQTFDDASTSNHTITANGDTTASTFSPHRHGGYSAYFDGSGDYLTIPDHADFNMGSENFTAECWIYPTASPSQPIIMGQWSGSYSWALEMSNNSSRYLRFLTNAGSIVDNVSSTAVPLNQWSHVALVRNGTSFVAYLNGTSVVSSTVTGALANSTDALSIGANASGSYAIQGYISNVRVVKGTAVYTSNFTSPTAPLTAITNTKFLLGRLPYFKDQSASNHTITVGGNTSLKPKSLFDNAAYSEAAHGASAYFDGTGDYLDLNGDAEFAFGTNDFTIEFWYYSNGSQTGNFCDFRPTSTQGTYTLLYVNSDNTIRYHHQSGDRITSSAISHNVWTHLALTRSGTDVKLFINGQQEGSTFTNSLSQLVGANRPRLGSSGYYSAGATHFNGYMSDIRILNGTAAYTSNFAPPTSPPVADSNTKFLLNPETSISDLSQGSALRCYGNASTDSTTVKFAGTKSLAFDGTGDDIRFDAISLDNDFTLEYWLKLSTYNADYGIFGDTGASNAQQRINHNGSFGKIMLYYGSYVHATTDCFTQSEAEDWMHIAYSRQNGSFTLYVNGILKDTVSNTQVFNVDIIGAGGYNNGSNHFSGYIQDFRITKGLARYTSNFTPPTAELEG